MGKDDYATAGGGALKLKGAKNAGIEKKRKKEKKPKPMSTEAVQSPASNKDDPANKDEELDLGSNVNTDIAGTFKTEAERRHEETRRKRVRQQMLKLCQQTLTFVVA